MSAAKAAPAAPSSAAQALPATSGSLGSPGIVGVGGTGGVLLGADGINGLMQSASRADSYLVCWACTSVPAPVAAAVASKTRLWIDFMLIRIGD